MDLSIIIVSYNVRSFLEQALRTIIDASEALETEIFVVDNNSSDGSQQMVRQDFPDVHLICNQENLGFAKANNQALERCRGRYILLINPDIIVRRDTIKAMVGFLDEHPEAGAAGCKVLNPDGSLQLSCRRGFPTPRAAFFKIMGLSGLSPKNPRFAGYNLTYLDPDRIHEVDALSGSFMMVRKEILDSVGPLDETFFMYGEDLDWCYRIKKAGWKIFYVPTTEIIHFKGESTKKVPKVKNLIAFYKAMHIFVRKHLRKKYLLFPEWLLTLGILLRGLLSLIVRGMERLLTPLADFLLVSLGLGLGIAARFYWFNQPPAHLPPFNTQDWLTIFAVCSGIWVATFYFMGLYDKNKYSPLRALTGVFIGFIGITLFFFSKKGYNFSRLVAFYTWGFNSIFVPGWRAAARRIFRTQVGRRTLILGTGTEAISFLRTIRQHPDLDYEIVGFIGNPGEMRGKLINGARVIGLAQDLPEVVKEYKIDQIVIITQAVPYSQILSLNSGRRNVQFKLLPGSFETMANRQEIKTVEDIPLIDIACTPRWSLRRLWKRIF